MAVVGKGWEVPPEADSQGDFRWFKVHGVRAVHLVILSDAPLFYRGHFLRERMVPCAGEGCVFCANNVGAQLRWVFAAVEPFTGQIGLMEVGRSVGLELRAKSEQAGKFKGLVVKFWRHSKSPKSRIEMDVVDMPVSKSWLVLPVPDIGKALKLTWQRSGKADDEVLEAVGEASPGALEEALRMAREHGAGKGPSGEVSIRNR